MRGVVREDDGNSVEFLEAAVKAGGTHREISV